MSAARRDFDEFTPEERKLVEQLNREGYWLVMDIPDHGFCGLRKMFHTTALVVDMDYCGYAYRYCFETAQQAVTQLILWEGGDTEPTDYIVRKGLGEDLYL